MFSKKIAQIKKWAIEQVLWAEKNLHGKTGAEKKAAVVKKLDDMIQLPAPLEWVDDLIISLIVDKACESLNTLMGHNFGEAKLDEKQEEKIIEAIEIPKEKIK